MATLLPPELLLKILSYHLPSPSYEHFQTRSSQLRTFSLVCPSWRAVGQTLLFQHPRLESKIRLRKYLEAVERREGQKECRSLRIGGAKTDLEGRDLVRLLRRMKGGRVREVYVRGVGELDWGDFNALVGLESLHLHQCYFRPSTRIRLSLPRLRNLSLLGVMFEVPPPNGMNESVFHPLTPSSVPSLRHLAIESLPLFENDSDDLIHSVISQLGPRLFSLAVGFLRHNADVPWIKLSSLRCFSIDLSYYTFAPRQNASLITDLLHRLPPTGLLTHLHIPHTILNLSPSPLALEISALGNLELVIYGTSDAPTLDRTSPELKKIRLEAKRLEKRHFLAKTKWEGRPRADQEFYEGYWNVVKEVFEVKPLPRAGAGAGGSGGRERALSTGAFSLVLTT